MPLAILALALASGCASTPPPSAATAPPASAAPPAPAAKPAEDERLTPLLHDLGLTPAQAAEVIRLDAELRSKAEPLVGASMELGRSVAGAARQCKGDTPFIESDARAVVREGEAMRQPTLEAIQRVHALLTPVQRGKVSQRLLEGDEWAKRERKGSSRTRDLRAPLSLSAAQTMSVLMKAGVLWSSFADKTDPWQTHYRAAVTHFARDDFDVRREPIADAPAVALMVDFVRAGLRLLIPVLEPPQCAALGQLIDDKLDEQAAKMRANR